MSNETKTIEEMRQAIEEMIFQNTQKKFPELVPLNKDYHNNEKPVFWFHSVGGVQPYSIIATMLSRPFYGIESRGFRSNRQPLQGIQAMAAYYIHIIKSVQINGPYDLGGYSLGGLIAYEAARQLQEHGDQVRSIVMLDTLAPHATPLTKNIPFKSRLLQGVNFILATKVINDHARLKKVLIHHDEVDWEKNDEDILSQLSELAKRKGAFESIDQLKRHIMKNATIQVSYEYERYILHRLDRPEEVNCYYFRNSSGLFFGDLQPFYTTPGEEVLVDHIDYWTTWRKLLPKIEIIDVNASNHMVFFSEKPVYQEICKFCYELYSSVNGVAQ